MRWRAWAAAGKRSRPLSKGNATRSFAVVVRGKPCSARSACWRNTFTLKKSGQRRGLDRGTRGSASQPTAKFFMNTSAAHFFIAVNSAAMPACPRRSTERSVKMRGFVSFLRVVGKCDSAMAGEFFRRTLSPAMHDWHGCRYQPADMSATLPRIRPSRLWKPFERWLADGKVGEVSNLAWASEARRWVFAFSEPFDSPSRHLRPSSPARLETSPTLPAEHFPPAKSNNLRACPPPAPVFSQGATL